MKSKACRKNAARRVNFVTCDEDWMIAQLASIGQEARVIAKQVGCTPAHVYYRCRAAGISLRTFRRGKGEYHARVMGSLNSLFSTVEQDHLRARFNTNHSQWLVDQARARALKVLAAERKRKLAERAAKRVAAVAIKPKTVKAKPTAKRSIKKATTPRNVKVNKALKTSAKTKTSVRARA